MSSATAPFTLALAEAFADEALLAFLATGFLTAWVTAGFFALAELADDEAAFFATLDLAALRFAGAGAGVEFDLAALPVLAIFFAAASNSSKDCSMHSR